MTELETEVKIERDIARAERRGDANVFSARTFSNSTTDDLKKFETYKPVDLNALFEKLEKDSQKASAKQEQIDNTDLDNFTKLETDAFPVVMSKTVEIDEPKMSFKINLKGKLIIFVASVALVLLTFFAIFNAVTIHKLNASISAMNEEIIVTEKVLNEKIKTYNALTDEGTLNGKAQDFGFSEIDGENVHKLSVKKVNSTTSEHAENQDNWFDNFCDWVANLFGA